MDSSSSSDSSESECLYLYHIKISRIEHYFPLIINKTITNDTFITYLKDRGIPLTDPSFKSLSLKGKYYFLCLIKNWHQNHQPVETYYLETLDLLLEEINDVNDSLTEIKGSMEPSSDKTRSSNIKILTCTMVLLILGLSIGLVIIKS